MKNLCFIFILLPFFCIGQNLSFFPVTNDGSSGSDLVHIAKKGDGMRVFTKEASTCGKLTMNGPEETKFNQFYVMDYDADGNMTKKKKYIMYKYEFPSGTYTFKKGRITYGTNEDVVTYDQLVEMYPTLETVDRIDRENRKYPHTFYEAELKKNFSSRIIGYESTQFVKKDNPQSKEPKKGKVLGKLTGVSLTNLLGSPDIYDKIDAYEHDWKDSYKDAQKKSYWLSEFDASCQKTGNIITYQAYDDNDDDTNRFKQKEIVVFGSDGSIVKTLDAGDGKQWKTIAKAKNTEFNDGVGTLKSISIGEVEAFHKKKNPSASKKNLRIQNINSNGEVAYNHTIELPFDFGALDTLILSDTGKTFISGSLKKGPYFVASCDKDNCKTTLLGNEDNFYGKAKEMISTKQGDFAIYVKSNYKFHVFPLSDGAVEPLTVPVQSNDVIRSSVDYYESDKGVIFAFKDSSLGINKFKWEMTHVQLMQYKDSKLVPISNFEQDQFVLGEDKSYRKSNFVEFGGDVYMLGRVFKKGDDGKLRNSNTLAKLNL